MIGGERNNKNNIDFSYYRVYGWMSSHLGLKGTEKEIFAVIYHYTTTKNTKGYFNGSGNYLSELTGISRRNIIKNLKNLLEKGYIEVIENNFIKKKPNVYRPTIEILNKYNTATCDKTSHDNNIHTTVTCDKTSHDDVKHVTNNHMTCDKTSHNNKEIIKDIDNKYIDHQSKIDDACDFSSFSSLDTETGLQETEYPSSYQKDHEQKDSTNTEEKDQASAMTEKEKEKSRQKKEKKEGKYTKQDYIEDIKAYTDNTELQDALLDFYNMRKNAINKLISTKGTTKRLLNKLDKLAETDEEKSAIVYKAVDNCWQGFFGQNKKAADESQQLQRARYSNQFDEPDEKPIDPVKQAEYLKKLREARKRIMMGS